MKYFLIVFTLILCISLSFTLFQGEIIIKRYEIEEFAKEMGEPHYFGLDVDENGNRVFRVNLTLKKDIVQEDGWECEVLSEQKINDMWKRGSFNYLRGDCCKTIKNEKLVLGKMFEDFKLEKRCPIKAGYYQTNKGITLDTKYLPVVLPGKDWRFTLKVFYRNTQKIALKMGIEIEIDRSKKYRIG